VNETVPEPYRPHQLQHLRTPHLRQPTYAASRIAPFALCLFCIGLPLQAQQGSQQLSPSEALRWAMDPFDQARSQDGDLTDADKLALGLGMERAAHDCRLLTSASPSAPLAPAEILALGRLCLFGREFEPARATLVNYLALPSPPEREAALILLTRAFLGIKSPGSAAIQVLSLVRDYPYDAQIHTAADQVISACEDTRAGLDSYAAQLCKKQTDATLPLLLEGKSLQGKDETIPAARLFADALRCSVLARDSGDQTSNESLDDLQKIVQQPNWQGTADLFPMQQALARAQMTGQTVPLRILHARQFSPNRPMVPRALVLHRGTIVLAFFTLWSPSAVEAINNLADAAPAAGIYAVTSWRANTGGKDEPSPEILPALREMSQNLPRKVPLLIVPDAELNAFHLDQYPAGIAIADGIVISNVVLADAGSIRMALYGIHPAFPVAKPNPHR